MHTLALVFVLVAVVVWALLLLTLTGLGLMAGSILMARSVRAQNGARSGRRRVSADGQRPRTVGEYVAALARQNHATNRAPTVLVVPVRGPVRPVTAAR